MSKKGSISEYVKNMRENQKKLDEEKKKNIQSSDYMQKINKHNTGNKKNNDFFKKMQEEQKKSEAKRIEKVSGEDDMQKSKKNSVGALNSKVYVENMKKNQNKIENEKKDDFINKDGMKKSKKELVSRNNKEYVKQMNENQKKIEKEKKENIINKDDMQNFDKKKIGNRNNEEHIKNMNENQNKLEMEKKKNIMKKDDMINIDKDNINNINSEEYIKNMNENQNKLDNEKKDDIINKDNMLNFDKDNIGTINIEEYFGNMSENQKKLEMEKIIYLQKLEDMLNSDEIINDPEYKEKRNNIIKEINLNIEKEKLESEPVEKEEEKVEEVLGTDDILENKEKFTIYKYPDFQFPPVVNNNCKVLLMIGNAQKYFIDTFITMYSNIKYDDNFRYSIGAVPNSEISIYNIKFRNPEKNYDIKIISIPSIEQMNDLTMRNMIELFKEKIPRNCINLICFTFEENKEELNVYEKIFYKLLINLLDYRAKLLFLISSNDLNSEINNYNQNYLIDKLFNFEKKEKDKLDIVYISFNNKIIFDCDENNWNKIKEKMDIIKNEILFSKRGILTKEKIDVMNLILLEEKEKIAQKFIEFDINEKLIILYYLLDICFYLGENLSDLILSLLNIIIISRNHNIIHQNNDKLEFFNDQNCIKYINILSKLSLNFAKLEYIRIMNCVNDENILDNTMYLFEKITKNKIKNLNLAKNKISDLTWLNNLDIFSNLETLDLSNNNIVNLSPLMKCKFNYLENFNLSHNKISNIEWFKNNNFRSLKYLNLSENEINSGLNEFSFSFTNTSEELLLVLKCEKNYDEIFFKYNINLDMEFKYTFKDKNFNDILKNISFEGIKSLKLKNFDNNIHFLENRTLEYLKTLDIIDNNITNLSIFNNIKFAHIDKIFKNRENDFLENIFWKIKEGFKYLKSFTLINTEKLEIELNSDNKTYNIYTYFKNPELNILFNNTDFLFDDILSNTKDVIIPGTIFDIDGNSTNLFSYYTLKNYILPFLKNIYSEEIKIDYIKEKNIYECEIKFLNPYINIKVNFNDLSFINDSNILNKTEKIYLNHIPNNELNKIQFEKFSPSLYIQLNNIYIENIEIISKLYSRNIATFNVECIPNLIDPMESFDFKKIIRDNRIKYFYPSLVSKKIFCFEIRINKEILNRINFMKNCLYINLVYMNINENDLTFLNKECFSSIINLNLSNNKIKNIYLVTYNSLANLETLDLSNNEIEDINLLNDENNKFKNLKLLKINNNPIRKGLEVVKQKFFMHDCLYITVNDIDKKNAEYYISLKFNNTLSYIDLKIDTNEIKTLINYTPKEEVKDECRYIYLDFYLENVNSLWDLIDYNYTFFDFNLTFEKLVDEYNLNITNEDFFIKNGIHYYLISILYIRRRDFIYSLDLGNKDEIIKNLFKLVYDKGYNYLIELNEIDLYLNFDKIKYYFSFLNSDSLNNYNFEGLLGLNEIDFSQIKLNDIRTLCSAPLISLKTLKLCNNTKIINLYELKNAKFINLQNLDLSQDGINDLEEIGMKEYPFKGLISLNLGYNNIEKIEPILHFEILQNLNLEYNNLSSRVTLIMLENLKSCRGPELRGNKQ